MQVTVVSMERVWPLMLLLLELHTSGVLLTRPFLPFSILCLSLLFSVLATKKCLPVRRLETACETVLTTGEGSVEDGADITDLAHKVTDHLMHHFTMLRNVRDEAVSPGNFCRRFKFDKSFFYKYIYSYNFKFGFSILLKCC